MEEPIVDEGATSGEEPGVTLGRDALRRPPIEGPRDDGQRDGDPTRSPDTTWPPWTAIAALLGGIVLAGVGGVILDIPAALLFGVKLSGENLSPGLAIADTVVQDIGFVLVAVYFAHIGGRVVRSWQFGLRRPGDGWTWAAGLVVALLIAFIVLSVLWALLVKPGSEKTLEQLGSNESTALLLLSAALTCVVAPMCEEFLFRGYIFTALRNWGGGTMRAAVVTGILFGAVHAESAPVLDLIPLAALGFGLCLLYRYTGSLYPCMAAHSINNSIAFAALEHWRLLHGHPFVLGWRPLVLLVGSLFAIAGVVRVCERLGLIEPRAGIARSGA